MDKAKSKTGKKKQQSGTVTRFLKVMLVLIVLFLAGLAGLLYWAGTKAFSAAPLPPQVVAFTSEDVMSAFQKIQPVGPAVLQSHPDQIMQLALTTAEVNALLGIVNNSGLLTTVSGISLNLPKNLVFRMENNSFWFTWSKKIDYTTPFGKYLNLEVAVEPLIKSGKVNYQIAVCRVGQLTVPEWVLRKYVEWELFNNSEAADMMKKAVIDFYVDASGRLQLKFYPFQLRQLFLNYVKSNSSSREKTGRF